MQVTKSWEMSRKGMQLKAYRENKNENKILLGSVEYRLMPVEISTKNIKNPHLAFNIETARHFETLLCVPERTGTRETAAMSKNVSTIFTFLFWIYVCLLHWAVCVRKSLNQSNSCENVALNVDTNTKQNLELLLSAADFHFLFGHSMCSLMHLCPPGSVAKIDITNRYLIKIKIAIWYEPRGHSHIRRYAMWGS